MADTVAHNKFSCPACGAEATWNPAKKALVCGFCGTTSPANIELGADGAETIVEHDLIKALRAIPDSARGWDAQKTEVKCQSCQAISVFDPERVGQRCDFCGSASLVPHEQAKGVFRPESVLEFKLGDTQVRDALKEWYRTRWFAPNALKTRALTDTLHGIYLPYWTFDAQVHADWTAESGTFYYTTETYRDSNGKTQTRQVQHIRWSPSAGALDHFFDDTLVPASKGVGAEKLAKLEPFPMKELKPYNPGFLAGWVVERYQVDLGLAAQTSRARMDAALQQMCARQVPGDTHRNLQVNAQYERQTFKHVLLPVWIISYDYHGKPFQVVINGFTGTLHGAYPKSWAKIALLVIAILAVVALIFALGR